MMSLFLYVQYMQDRSFELWRQWGRGRGRSTELGEGLGKWRKKREETDYLCACERQTVSLFLRGG